MVVVVEEEEGRMGGGGVTGDRQPLRGERQRSFCIDSPLLTVFFSLKEKMPSVPVGSWCQAGF